MNKTFIHAMEAGGLLPLRFLALVINTSSCLTTQHSSLAAFLLCVVPEHLPLILILLWRETPFQICLSENKLTCKRSLLSGSACKMLE